MRIFLFVAFAFSLSAGEIEWLKDDPKPTEEARGIQVNLRNPSFENGVLQSTQGGVITAPRFRLQAQNVIYTKTKELHTIEAEGCIMVEAGEYLFVGDRLEYDFDTETGRLYNGRTAQLPWYVGGEVIILNADGSYTIENAFITTSETLNSDWKINAGSVTLNKNRQISARDLYGQLFRMNLLWFPSLNVNLSSLTDAPIRFNAKWGGKQGGRLGLIYNFFNVGRFKAFVRLDYRLNRGPGGGFETYYLSEDHKESLETINYIARDNALELPKERTRYRFQGVYRSKVFDDTTSIFATWDKLSDEYMATDYNDQGLELDYPGRTELLIRRQEEWWITELRSKVRLNTFQTVKQELPTIFITHKPSVLGRSGVIWENALEASYLDFTYENNLSNVSDYNSTRLDYLTRLYRPFSLFPVKITPEIGGTSIVYGNSPNNNSKTVAVGFLGFNVNSSFHHANNYFKHVVMPYFEWNYFSGPTVNPDEHYIFDIDDGLYRLESFKVGTKHDIIARSDTLKRLLEVDLYTFLFINRTPIPKLYLDLTTRSIPTLTHRFTIAYDYQQEMLDQFNWRNDWTINKNLALSLEYRHRSPYAYRKCVRDNYMLEAFRSTSQLLHSSVSDRRDTLLFHAYWRFHPLYALEFTSRSGWNRRHEPNYSEYEVDLYTQLKSHWLVKVSYQHTEEDDRVAIYFTLLSSQPNKDKGINLLSPVEF
jgi:hypothetical protein